MQQEGITWKLICCHSEKEEKVDVINVLYILCALDLLVKSPHPSLARAWFPIVICHPFSILGLLFSLCGHESEVPNPWTAES